MNLFVSAHEAKLSPNYRVNFKLGSVRSDQSHVNSIMCGGADIVSYRD